MNIDNSLSVSQIQHDLVLISQERLLSFRYGFSCKCLAHFSGFLMLSTSFRVGSDPALTIGSGKSLTGFSVISRFSFLRTALKQMLKFKYVRSPIQNNGLLTHL